MRHGNKNNALGRKSAHKNAMMSNMACSLIEHKRITTTVAKAKELRKFVEPIINRSKEDSTHSRRIAFSYLKSKDAVSELFRDVAPKVTSREGGYTRIIKLGFRQGDAAEMCMIELVDFNELLIKDTKAKTRRSRRGAKKSSDTAKPAVEAKAEAPTAETAESTEEVKAEAVAAAEEAPAADAAPEAEAPQTDATDTPTGEESKEEDKKD